MSPPRSPKLDSTTEAGDPEKGVSPNLNRDADNLISPTVASFHGDTQKVVSPTTASFTSDFEKSKSPRITSQEMPPPSPLPEVTVKEWRNEACLVKTRSKIIRTISITTIAVIGPLLYIGKS